MTKTPGARRQYLLHLRGSLGPARVASLRRELAGLGAQLGNYIPSHTHLVQAPPRALAAMRGLEGAADPAPLMHTYSSANQVDVGY